MSSIAAALLIEAGQRIADTNRWTVGAMARDRNGDNIDPTHRKAVKFDAIGSVVKACGVDLDDEKDWRQWRHFTPCMFELHSAAARLYQRTLEGVNDDLGHAETLCVFRAAIKRARLVSGESNQ